MVRDSALSPGALQVNAFIGAPTPNFTGHLNNAMQGASKKENGRQNRYQEVTLSQNNDDTSMIVQD